MFASTGYTPRQTHHLGYISKFITDICHIPGTEDAVADTLSRNPSSVLIITKQPDVDYTALAAAQAVDPEMPPNN